MVQSWLEDLCDTSQRNYLRRRVEDENEGSRGNRPTAGGEDELWG